MRLAGLFRFSFIAAISAYVLVAVVSAQGTATKTVWNGVFTDAQAQRGRGFYQEHCAMCHGGGLEGGEGRALQGDRFWVTWQETTVEDLLRKVTTTMPHSEDGSLKGTLGAHIYADIVAHMLSMNGFPAGAAELTAASSAGIQIVKKDGSGELPSGAFAHVVGCLARGSGKDWKIQKGSRPVRVIEGKDPDVKASLGDREYALMFVLTSLDKFEGHRMSVRASLVGDGGAKGLNVSVIRSVGATCE